MSDPLQFSLNHGGAILFAVVFLEQAGLPIPAAPWLLAAGAFCAAGDGSAAMILWVTMAACLSADSAWFYLGRHRGKRIVQWLCRLALPQSASLEHIEQSFVRHGMAVIALAKFLPGLSVVAPPLAGAFGIGAGRFLLFDLLGAALYGASYLLLGAAFSSQVQAILSVLNRIGLGSVVLLVALLAVYAGLKYTAQRQANRREKTSIQTIQQPVSI